jgi:hypothetical protein
MVRSDARRVPALSFAQVVVGLAGLSYIVAGGALLLAPAWFFANIGPFAPFNRHYEGDTGAFLFPLGLGLLLAARAPARQRLLVAVGACASLLHAVNHTYDGLLAQWPVERWLTDTLPLAVLAVALLVVLWRLPERGV